MIEAVLLVAPIDATADTPLVAPVEGEGAVDDAGGEDKVGFLLIVGRALGIRFIIPHESPRCQ